MQSPSQMIRIKIMRTLQSAKAKVAVIFRKFYFGGWLAAAIERLRCALLFSLITMLANQKVKGSPIQEGRVFCSSRETNYLSPPSPLEKFFSSGNDPLLLQPSISNREVR